MTTILLIEDETNLAGILRRELEVKGYEVLHAADGLEGWAFFQRRAPDLVILDWMLPGLNGLDVLRRIRGGSAVPVLMLTARGEVTDRVVGLEVGADDYLVKPFSLPELVARVGALLRREERIRAVLAQDQDKPAQVITYASLALDPQEVTCTLDGELLELTAIEFELLALLLAHPGRTFNRMYLVETVWKATFLEGDRAVDNVVLRLRKKLGGMGERLETVRGMGYRIRRLETNQPIDSSRGKKG